MATAINKAYFNLHRSISPKEVSDYRNEPQVWPGQYMSWSNPGDVTIQGTKWSSDANLTMTGDPTSATNAVIKLNTGANHDCNALWSCPKDYATERLVRGVFFRNYTNKATFRPRISGVALQYKKADGTTRYSGLGYRSNYYTEDKGGELNYEDGYSTNEFWAVGYGQNHEDGSPWDETDWMFSGVLFHFETTWKMGSAEDCIVWINSLRPITQGNIQPVHIWYGNKWRIWGSRVQ